MSKQIKYWHNGNTILEGAAGVSNFNKFNQLKGYIIGSDIFIFIRKYKSFIHPITTILSNILVFYIQLQQL